MTISTAIGLKFQKVRLTEIFIFPHLPLICISWSGVIVFVGVRQLWKPLCIWDPRESHIFNQFQIMMMVTKLNIHIMIILWREFWHFSIGLFIQNQIWVVNICQFLPTNINYRDLWNCCKLFVFKIYLFGNAFISKGRAQITQSRIRSINPSWG